MNIHRIIPVSILILSVNACSSTPTASVSTATTLNIDAFEKRENLAASIRVGEERAPSKEEEQEFDEAKQKAVSADVDALIAYCQPILGGLERRSQSWARAAFWVSMAGVIAGAVVAPVLIAANPHANAALIAGFSGFAGATNTASIAMETSGLSGTASARERNQIIERIRAHMNVLLDPKASVPQIRLNLIAARAECALYEISVPTIPGGKKTN